MVARPYGKASQGITWPSAAPRLSQSLMDHILASRERAKTEIKLDCDLKRSEKVAVAGQWDLDIVCPQRYDRTRCNYEYILRPQYRSLRCSKLAE